MRHRVCSGGHMTRSKPPLAFHLVFRTCWPTQPWKERDRCLDVWRYARDAFPQVYATALLPDHLHLVVPARPMASPDWGQVELWTRMRLLRKRLVLLDEQLRVEPVPMPEPIQDAGKLLRQVRYVHLNPCREGLCRDPLEWEWSTHLDLLGAIVDPWPNRVLTLEKMGLFANSRSIHTSLRKLHSYVSSDPSVHVSGTPYLFAAKAPVLIDLKGAVMGAAKILRLKEVEIMRRGKRRALVMRVLASEFKVPQVQVARFFGVDRTSLRPMRDGFAVREAKILKEVGDAMRIVLSDSRLSPH